MAQPFSRLCYQGVCAIGRGAVTLAFWTLWLALILLLAAQTYVASTNELPVPAFVQRALEERLAVSGIHATFGRTIFDPSGRILIENVRIKLPGFEDSVVTARAIYARLDPWALLADRFEPLDLRVTGVSLRVPALLSPSGRADEIVRDLDAAFLPRGNELTVEYANCHLGNLAVSVEGDLRLATPVNKPRAPLPIADFLAQSYGEISRESANVLGRLGVFDHPLLQVHLTPAEPNGATARFTLTSRECRLDPPTALEASGVQVDGVCSLAGATVTQTDVFLSADKMSLPRFGVAARGLRARLLGHGAPGKATSGRPALALGEVEMTAATVTGMGQVVRGAILRVRGAGSDVWSELQPAHFEPVRAELQATLWDQPLSTRVDVDFDRRAADARFAGAVGPGVLDALGAHWHRDFHPYAALAAPVQVDGEARFESGWKFAGVSAWVAAQGVTYKEVTIDDVRGRINFDGRHLEAPEASARIGEDDARGSYEMDVVTRDYRFLLDGHLRPLDISPWIIGTWWPNFFGNFAFPSGPPTASVDLRSCWVNGRKLELLVFFDGAGTVIRGVPFDRVRTRLFVRPQFDDGLDFFMTRGTGVARGTFARRLNPDLRADSLILDFDVKSTLDPGPIIKDAGPAFPATLAAYVFGKPPTVAFNGHYAGPAAPEGKHLALHVDARTAGDFSYQGFPFDGASAIVDVKDDDVAIPQVAAGFAGGNVKGHAGISGEGAERKLSFDGALAGANLGRAISVVEAFTARRSGQPPPPLRNFLKEKADLRLDLNAAAEGRLADPFSYQGAGNVTVQGPDLGEVRMLGVLSELLPFTALRFTSARAGFKIEGNKLVFPAISVIGANSGIAASGTYALDRRTLDFHAKIEPFQESKSVPQKFMGLMLTPLTGLFAVRLSGTLDKPTGHLDLGGGGAEKPSVLAVPSPLKSR